PREGQGQEGGGDGGPRPGREAVPLQADQGGVGGREGFGHDSPLDADRRGRRLEESGTPRAAALLCPLTTVVGRRGPGRRPGLQGGCLARPPPPTRGEGFSACWTGSLPASSASGRTAGAASCSLDHLIHSEREARAVRQKLGAPDGAVLLGEQASK